MRDVDRAWLCRPAATAFFMSSDSTSSTSARLRFARRRPTRALALAWPRVLLGLFALWSLLLLAWLLTALGDSAAHRGVASADRSARQPRARRAGAHRRDPACARAAGCRRSSCATWCCSTPAARRAAPAARRRGAVAALAARARAALRAAARSTAPRSTSGATPHGRIRVAGLDFGGAAPQRRRRRRRRLVLQAARVRDPRRHRALDRRAARRAAAGARRRRAGGAQRPARHDMRLDATPPAGWGDRFTLRARSRQPLFAARRRLAALERHAFAELPRADVRELRRDVALPFELSRGRRRAARWFEVATASPTQRHGRRRPARGRAAPSDERSRWRSSACSGRPSSDRARSAPARLAAAASPLPPATACAGAERACASHCASAKARAGWADAEVTAASSPPTASIGAHGPLAARCRSARRCASCSPNSRRAARRTSSARAGTGRSTRRALPVKAPGAAACRSPPAPSSEPHASAGRAGATPVLSSRPARPAASAQSRWTSGAHRAARRVRRAGEVPFDRFDAQLTWKIEPRRGAPPASRCAVERRPLRQRRRQRASCNAAWRTGAAAAGPRRPLSRAARARRQARDARAARMARYLPLGLPDSVRRYVAARGPRRHDSPSAQFRVRGDLWDFPFHAPTPRASRAHRGHAQGVDASPTCRSRAGLAPATGRRSAVAWPVVHRVAGELVFDRTRDGDPQREGALCGVELTQRPRRDPRASPRAGARDRRPGARPAGRHAALRQRDAGRRLDGRRPARGQRPAAAPNSGWRWRSRWRDLDADSVKGALQLAGNDVRLARRHAAAGERQGAGRLHAQGLHRRSAAARACSAASWPSTAARSQDGDAALQRPGHGQRRGAAPRGELGTLARLAASPAARRLPAGARLRPRAAPNSR